MNRMEFTSAGDPNQWWVASTAEMLAQFGHPVAVLTARPPDSTLDIGGGGVNEQIWYIDADYRLDQQLGARVRTIRELTPPPSHAPGDFLRSALIEFSVNAELASGRTLNSDADERHGMHVTVGKEQQAALATPTAGTITINGRDHAAVTLHIPGYLGSMTTVEQTTVVYVANDDALIPALRMTISPGQD